jgi:hypothetical protein
MSNPALMLQQGMMNAQRLRDADLAEEEARRGMAQTQIDRQRQNAARDALIGRYGVEAGDPVAYGQLEGIDQRRTMFDRGIENEDRDLQMQAAQRAAAVISQMRENGADEAAISQRLAAMPDAVFGGPERAGQARELALQYIDDPQALAGALSGELAGPQFGEANFFDVDGEEVFGRPVFDSQGNIVDLEPLPFQPVSEQVVQFQDPDFPGILFERDLRTNAVRQVAANPAAARTGDGDGETAGRMSPDLFRITQSLDEDVFNAQQNAAEDALSRTGVFSAGFANTVSGWLGGTPSRDLNTAIDALTAPVVFDQLRQMREQAADMGQRGSGLGQVTQREIELLSSVLGSLDPTASPEVLRQNLQDVMALRERIFRRRTYLNAIRAGAITEEEAVRRLEEEGLTMSVFDRNRDYSGGDGRGRGQDLSAQAAALGVSMDRVRQTAQNRGISEAEVLRVIAARQNARN